MGVGDLVTDEYGVSGVITGSGDADNYVEVTFFGGLYGLTTCQVHYKFLTLVSKAKK